ncbi:DUF732 domain-containing protein [Mycobacterium paragordonae]|jgi:hypothetical protein|uniref:DUF732 domain-containing protein n=1 Tax=Mycobacterium paragordonae TaxID=1389713 RepID=A0ABQ1C0R5_9MYCO|nr:DUF732 domain-containing protein [Mycobacterium paragordonae]PJE24447.1 MAG: DUF732 domain-containing protein [Mycobacterium sp.]GFG78023.1 hypothetical protein MPRG_12990 [Mycobacterium paragordonae]
MRHLATLAASVSVLAVLICPVAQADPNLSPEDANFGKYLAQAGINNQSHVPLQVLIGEAHAACAMLDQSPTTEQWHAAVDMIAAGPGSFSKTDARTIGQAGVNSYCRNYTQLSNT